VGGDGGGDGAEEAAGDFQPRPDTEDGAGERKEERFGDDEDGECASTEAEGTEEAELRPTPRDVGGDGVGDEKHADNERDKGEGGEVELKGSQHSFDLATAPIRGPGACVGGEAGSEPFGEGLADGFLFRRRGSAEDGFDAVDLASELKAGLDGGDVGEGEVIVGADKIVRRFEQKADAEGGFPAAVHGAESVTDLQPKPLGEAAGKGDGIGFGDERDGIGRIFQRVLEPVGDEFTVGEGIDPDEMEEFARMGGEGGDHLKHRGGLADGGIGAEDGEERFGQAEPLALHREVRPTGDEIEGCAEGPESGFVDRLDGDDGSDPDGKSSDVQEGEGFVGEKVATAVGKEDAERGGPVQGEA